MINNDAQLEKHKNWLKYYEVSLNHHKNNKERFAYLGKAHYNRRKELLEEQIEELKEEINTYKNKKG